MTICLGPIRSFLCFSRLIWLVQESCSCLQFVSDPLKILPSSLMIRGQIFEIRLIWPMWSSADSANVEHEKRAGLFSMILQATSDPQFWLFIHVIQGCLRYGSIYQMLPLISFVHSAFSMDISFSLENI